MARVINVGRRVSVKSGPNVMVINKVFFDRRIEAIPVFLVASEVLGSFYKNA